MSNDNSLAHGLDAVVQCHLHFGDVFQLRDALATRRSAFKGVFNVAHERLKYVEGVLLSEAPNDERVSIRLCQSAIRLVDTMQRADQNFNNEWARKAGELLYAHSGLLFNLMVEVFSLSPKYLERGIVIDPTDKLLKRCRLEDHVRHGPWRSIVTQIESYTENLISHLQIADQQRPK